MTRLFCLPVLSDTLSRTMCFTFSELFLSHTLYGTSCHFADCFAWLNSWSPPPPTRVPGPPFLFQNLISPDTSCNRECLKQNLLWIAFRLNHHKRRRPIRSLEKHCIFSSMPGGLFHAILPVFSMASSFPPKAKPTASAIIPFNSYKFCKTITNLTSCGLNCWKRKFDSKWQLQIHNRVLKLCLSANFSCQSCDPALFCIQILIMPSFLVNHNYNKILESDWVLACSIFCWIGFTQRLSLVSISQLVTRKYAQ